VRRIAGLKRYWLYSRLLATAGAVLVAVAAWLPWVAVRVYDAAQTDHLSTPFLLDPGDLDASYFGGIVWGSLTTLGLLLVPFLWRRPRSRTSPQLTPLFYFAWVCVLSALGEISSGYIRHPSTTRLAPELGSRLLDIVQIQVQPGAWLGLASALIEVVATFALVIGMARLPLDARPTSAPSRSRRTAIGALVFGVLLFWLGTLIMPWATVNCIATPLFFGQCTGLPFSGVLADAIRVDVPGLDPLAAIYSANILLSGGALLVLIAVFLGARSRFFAFWVTVWLLVATGFVALASVGVRLAASQPVQLGQPSGSWSGDMGIFVTLLALGLGWIGAGGLWLSRQRCAST
jgi:hypothetical protein